jgi:hypothetical protein
MTHRTALGWPVHGSSVDSTVAGGRDSPELGLTVAPVHGGSPVMEQWRKEHVESLSQASLGRGRRCGDRAMAVKKRKRVGGGEVEDDGALPFYRG